MSFVNIEDAIKGFEVSEITTKQIAVGIDFGTTHCVVCLKNRDDIQFFGDKDGILIPSVVAIHKSNEYILIGHDAIRKIGNHDYAVIYSIKRLISQDLSVIDNNIVGQNILIKEGYILIFGQQYTIIDFVAYILTYLKGVAEKELQMNIESCVITVPARFDDGGRSVVKVAAEAIGLKVLRIINEPTAAALGYGLDNKREGIYAVYDFGGGTFDVSILRMQMGVFQVISTCGDISLGGDDLDIALLNLVSQKIGVELSIYEYKEKIQKLKHLLSTEYHVKIEINNKICEISLEQFEEIAAPFIQKTIDIMQEAMLDANKKEPNLLLQGVILVGGSTRVPMVKYMLKKQIKVDIFEDLNPDTIVALGAAIKASGLNGVHGDDILIDVVPLSIGVEMMGGIVEKIIHRNSAIPISVSQEFTTFKNNQTGIDLNIVQGERELAQDCRSLGKLLIRQIEPAVAGMAKILVNFRIDSDGILTVTALNKETQKEQQIEIKPTFGIDIENMKNMLYDSINNAKEDIVKRLLIETKIDSEQLLLIAKDAILKDGDLLDIAEKDMIEDCIQALENSLRSSIDREEIILLHKSLDSALSNFVDKRMNKYISQLTID